MSASSYDTYDPESPPPEFGHDMLKYFYIAEGHLHLNGGAYGALARPVGRFCQEFSESVEANPDQYYRYDFKNRLHIARGRVAKEIGAHTDECVFVPNVNFGVTTVLQNIDWREGDVIVRFSSAFEGIERSIRYVVDKHAGIMLSVCPLVFPISHEIIVDTFKAHLKKLAQEHKGVQIVAVIDAIVSTPGIYMPWREMVQVCRQEGVLSLIDAAHAIGHEVDVNLSEGQPDFWVTLAHKWLYAKRASGILYVPRRNQHIIKNSLMPSSDYVSPHDAFAATPPSFAELFYRTGITDHQAYLSVIPALDFRKWLGGERKIFEYIQRVAAEGGKRLADTLGTEVMEASLILNMVNIRAPVPSATSPSTIESVDRELLCTLHVHVTHFYHDSKWWVRCTPQIWNEVQDFERLGNILLTAYSKLAS